VSLLLLDAALGTELTRRGIDTSPPLWSARALLSFPAAVRAIHRENAAAGADVLTACTFRTHARNLEAAGFPPGEARSESARLARVAVRLAREGAEEGAPGRTLLVAGSIAPLEDCWRPDLVPPAAALEAEHAAQAGNLAAAGCDLLLVETMNCRREAVAAARAAAATGLPYAVSASTALTASPVSPASTASTAGTGRLLSGESLVDAALELASLPRPPQAIGVNCVPARRLLADLELLAAALPGFPLVAYGNTGSPLDDRDSFHAEPIEPAEYAALALSWVSRGATLVGACCGTDASFTAALARALPRALAPTLAQDLAQALARAPGRPAAGRRRGRPLSPTGSSPGSSSP